MRFSPNSPVVLEVRRILRDNSSGIFPTEIRRALIRRGRPGILESDVVEILTFEDFRRLPNGRYVLNEMEFEEEPDTKEEDPEEQVIPSTLRHLPDLREFVIFDLETTGLDPESDDFFQLGALKVSNGKPVSPIQNWYAHIEKQLPLSLRLKLHFQELDMASKIEKAASARQVLKEFTEFANGLPLVAHNGRTYDYRIIRRLDNSINNEVLDSLELFCLAFPQLSSHSLENLAKHFGYRKDGVKMGKLGESVAEVRLMETLATDSTGELFHTAPFDCLVLYLLLDEAIDVLKRLGNIKRELCLISPSVSTLIGYEEHTELDTPGSLSEIINLKEWISQAAASERSACPDLAFNQDAVESCYREYLSRKKGYSERKPQIDMINSVVPAFSDSRKMMIEGPTGTGKTLAYLIPSILYSRSSGRQILISTNVKNLQSQLFVDIEDIHDTKVIDFDYAMLKGRNNYICLRRLFEGYIEAVHGEDADNVSFEEKLAFILDFGTFGLILVWI